MRPLAMRKTRFEPTKRLRNKRRPAGKTSPRKPSVVCGSLSRPASDTILPFIDERISFEVPSDVSYLDEMLEYIQTRLVELGIVQADDCGVMIALDEAIVNAIKHGNKSDREKPVRIVAQLNSEGATFTVSDSGTGFSREQVPDPTDPSRLLEPRGRGLLLINHIMDQVCYNDCGNEIRMYKRSGRTGRGSELPEPGEDCSA